jgi:hypothetical protein
MRRTRADTRAASALFFILEHLLHSVRVEPATPAIIDGHIRRIEAAFAALREEVRAFRPDVLLMMIGDDQGDMFDKAKQPHVRDLHRQRGPVGAQRPRSLRHPAGRAPEARLPPAR